MAAWPPKWTALTDGPGGGRHRVIVTDGAGMLMAAFHAHEHLIVQIEGAVACLDKLEPQFAAALIAAR